MLGGAITGVGALWRAVPDAPQTRPHPSAAGMSERVLVHADRSLPRGATGPGSTSPATGSTPAAPLDTAADPRMKPAPTSNTAQQQGDGPRPEASGKGSAGNSASAQAAAGTSPQEETAAPSGGGDDTDGRTGTEEAPRESAQADRSGPAESAEDTPDAERARRLETRVVELVNAERAEEGCGPLRTDARLQRTARAHSADMARSGYFSHASPGGDSPWERAEAHGYSQPSGENIARGYDTANAVVDAWMESQGHRENILNCDSQATGVGVYLGGDDGPFWTQVFGYE